MLSDGFMSRGRWIGVGGGMNPVSHSEPDGRISRLRLSSWGVIHSCGSPVMRSWLAWPGLRLPGRLACSISVLCGRQRDHYASRIRFASRTMSRLRHRRVRRLTTAVAAGSSAAALRERERIILPTITHCESGLEILRSIADCGRNFPLDSNGEQTELASDAQLGLGGTQLGR